MRLLESIDGTGQVIKSGELLQKARYHIEVWQEQIAVGTHQNPHATVDGLKRIEGSLEIDPIEAVGLVGEDLTLELEDGRRLGFFLQSNDGTIAAKGALVRPGAH